MNIHIDSDNPKPIEQKIQELILKKLYIKVDEEQIFIPKEDFIALILLDVIALAKADYNVDKALKIALKQQPEYATKPEVKKLKLEEALEGFSTEIDAYHYYIEGLKASIDDDELFEETLLILNTETEILEKRLHELLIQALSRKLSESDAQSLGADRWQLLDNFANQVKLIASNETLDDAVEEAFQEFENYPNKHLVKKSAIKNELERFAPLAKEEIGIYKMALSMQHQNAEIPMILATVKQFLRLEE